MVTGGRGVPKDRREKRDSRPNRGSGPGSGPRPGSGARQGAGSTEGSAGGQRPAPADIDLRAQLPYFLARLAVLVVITVVLALVGVNLILSLLIAFAVAGVLTWPLGRMQRRAAQRRPTPPTQGSGGSDDGPRS